jgi:hypothetical protein
LQNFQACSLFLPIGNFACLEVKMIGKPYAGETQVRFDEGEQDFFPWMIPNGHEVGNDGYGHGSPYRLLRLFSTLPAMTRRLHVAQMYNRAIL